MLGTCKALTWPLGYPICRKRYQCCRNTRRRMDILRLRKVIFLVYSQRRIWCDCAQRKTKRVIPARSKHFIVMMETPNTASDSIPSQNTGILFYLTNSSLFNQNVSRDSGQRSACRYSTRPGPGVFAFYFNLCR